MHTLKRFLDQMQRETEAQIQRQEGASPDGHPSVSHLKGRLEAFRQIEDFVRRLEERDLLLSGAGSTFSPQG